MINSCLAMCPIAIVLTAYGIETLLLLVITFLLSSLVATYLLFLPILVRGNSNNGYNRNQKF